ncbi:BT_3044 domain-containing protein [Dysgonomonas sp. Marseille-P4677]|uniref:BT_3044 domain-containing protein n=1 Tax=Dysgonomonas sp. Marseille-P4677 TaxID=2364790 RepID=UPI001F42A6A4|nr:DUF4361 domain-containing protein [Dysgonomonas sp. Marseille-P4677]
MKKILLLSLSLIALWFISCDDELPMDKLMYPESVYLVGAKGRIIDRDLNIGFLRDTVHASVAISSSIKIDRDVTVEIEEDPSAIKNYNDKELGTTDVLYQNLASGIYSFPNPNVVVKKGEVYGTYPIYVEPSSLHIDSLYMIALRLKSSSDFELAKQDTVVLMRFNLMNDYSGLYYMDGVIKEEANPNDSIIYKSPRTLQAVVDGNTVRMYHLKNEWTKGATDYRPNYCFNISVNPDNSLSLATWQNFNILEGGGTYYPELKVYDLWYRFVEDGVTKKVSGFVYKERKNDEEQRIINDWMEENRK